MSQLLTVRENSQPIYDIMIEDDYKNLYRVFEKLKTKEHRICIVTDSTISQYYLEQVTDIVSNYAKVVETMVIKPGEEFKNLDTVNQVYEHLIEAKFDRKDFLVALGGGVVGDLTGYVAATYLRGISFIQMPTTLLSMVDSSVGGKTGVDYMSYKNMIGSFKQPKAVYANIKTLQTLNDKQFYSGFAEVVKYGYIRDLDFYQWLKKNRKLLLDKDSNALKRMVYQSCDNKRIVVENDPKENGERALLNFGHTIGHAIEREMNFQLLHGECVSIGMVAAGYMSYKKGYISLEDLEDIKETLVAFNLPISINRMDVESLIQVTKNDKKMDSGKIKFILLKEIGNAIIDNTVAEHEMKDGTTYVME